MNKESLSKIPRQAAAELLAAVEPGPGYDQRVLIAVECALNLEWWRGYHAACSVPDPASIPAYT